MNFSTYRSHLEKVIEQRNGYLLLASMGLALCLFETIIIFCLIGRERIVVVPPAIEKSFWVSAQNVSPEYLSEMTTFFANLRLNLTADSAATQRLMLLRYTDADYYGALKSQLVAEADKITEQHLSISFYPTTDVKVETKKLRTIIEGDLKTYVGETALPVKHVRYIITFKYNAGRLLIKSFEEVKNA